MKEKIQPSVDQDQVHDLLFGREFSWQEIIYDLINTEQLDPWDINITILTEKYLTKIEQLEQTDFFVSSKILHAASLLLRIKSEILLNKFVKSIDEILFGKSEDTRKPFEKLELEGELPELVPKSPMPRFKKVTLQELIEALNKAITTENRRIKKEVIHRNALREAEISIPKRTINIKDKIKNIHEKLIHHFNTKQMKKVTYTDFIGQDKEERILSFYPLLQLENNNKIWLHQPEHFEEIDIWLKKVYLKHHGDPFANIKQELAQFETEEQAKQEIEELKEGLEDDA